MRLGDLKWLDNMREWAAADAEAADNTPAWALDDLEAADDASEWPFTEPNQSGDKDEDDSDEDEDNEDEADQDAVADSTKMAGTISSSSSPPCDRRGKPGVRRPLTSYGRI